MKTEPLRVLLIEDNPGDAGLMKVMLEEAAGGDYAVTSASTLKEGLEILAGGPRDIILLDLALPDSTGLETLSKAQAAAPAVPVIVMTGLDDEKVAVNAVRRGAQDYLVKGHLDEDLLVRAIDYAIERKHIEEELREKREQAEELAANLRKERDVLEVITENSPQAKLVYLDRDFNYLSVNSSYAETCRRSKGELVGRNHFDVYPSEENEAIFRGVRDTGKAVDFKEKPFEFPDQPERGTTWWDWTLTPIKDASGHVDSLVFSLIDVTEKVRARQLNEALNGINESISQVLDFDAILSRALQMVGRIVGADSALASFYGDAGWTVKTSLNMDLDPGTLFEQAPVSDYIREHRQPLAIDDTETHDMIKSDNRWLPVRQNARSLLALPLLHKTDVIATLAFYFQKPHMFTQAEQDFSRKLSTSLSLALDNARLYEKEHESRTKVESYAAQLSLLHTIAISLNRETSKQKLLETVLRGAAQLTGAGIGSIILIEEGKTNLASLYYAPWYRERCMMPDDASRLHERIHELLKSGGGDSLRVGDFAEFERQLQLPAGHPALRGLLLGVIRDIRGRERGYFMLSHKEAGARFTRQDEDIIALLAAQSSVALISTENFEREHQVAETLQSALLPLIPRRSDVDIGLIYRSASPYSRLGGDFYDFVELEDGCLAVVIGDVCGKGLEAATATAMVKYMLRAYLADGDGPAECLTRLNNAAQRQIAMEKFVTVGMLLIDPANSTARYASAGHPAPYVLGNGSPGQVELSPAVPVGVVPGYRYTDSLLESQDGSCILLYTDGLIEARPVDGEPFGEKGVLETIDRFHRLPAQRVAEELLRSAVRYSEGNLRDDIALLVLRPTS